MTRFSIVLTGIEEIRSFQRSTKIEDSLSGKTQDFKASGPAKISLVFNNGDIRIPCDQATYGKIVEYWKNARLKEAAKPLRVVRKSEPDSIPEGADVFGGELPPPPEDEKMEEELLPGAEVDWSGAEDDGEDGVGQV